MNIRNTMRNKVLTSITAGCLLLGSAPAFAGVEDEPSAGEMVADAVVARPIGLLATIGGTAAFVVSLPFSALGGNVKEAADALVVGPAKSTFVRCLGCKSSGRYQSVDK
jgi:hypothetical protein